jgi:hypothetical protein
MLLWPLTSFGLNGFQLLPALTLTSCIVLAGTHSLQKPWQHLNGKAGLDLTIIPYLA